MVVIVVHLTRGEKVVRRYKAHNAITARSYPFCLLLFATRGSGHGTGQEPYLNLAPGVSEHCCGNIRL